MSSPDGELVITGAGQRITGWTGVAVSRGVERIPGTFDLRATSRYPGELRQAIPLNAPVTVAIGGQPVIVGYLERIARRLSDGAHEVVLVGRGRCCDLVDTAALIENQTVSTVSVAGLARQLVAKYATSYPGGPIQVVTPDGDGDGRTYPAFTINLGESPYELIERVARYEGLLVYEDRQGNLTLARVGSQKHASGFAEGRNVQSAELTTSIDGMFSVYIPLLMSTQVYDRAGAAPGTTSIAGLAPVPDPRVDRYRPRIIVSEQNIGETFLAEQRAIWERARRYGRGLRATVTVDSWLDSAGLPWTPNQRATVSLPSLGLHGAEWVITDVQYRRDEQSGTTAVVSLMPPEALMVEPVSLNPLSARDLVPGPPNAPAGEKGAPSRPPTAPNAGPPTAQELRQAVSPLSSGPPPAPGPTAGELQRALAPRAPPKP